MSACCEAVRRLAGVDRLWSRREYSTSNFLSEHGQRIPVLICISEGYDGTDDLHSVSVEDVRNMASLLTLFFTFYSPCVASPVGNSPQGGPGPSGLVHEEAHPNISYHT